MSFKCFQYNIHHSIRACIRTLFKMNSYFISICFPNKFKTSDGTKISLNTVYKKGINRLFESNENASEAKINITAFLINYKNM